MSSTPPGLPPKYAKLWHAVAALIVAIAALVIAITQTGGQTQPPPGLTGVEVQRAAVRSANVTPNPACNPALGAGRMGVCAPPSSPLTPFAAPRVLHGLLGVDVSSYQGCANFSGARFAFTKLNESTGYRDPRAGCNVASARARHVPLGGYDFLRPGRTSASAEAAAFVAAYHAAGVTGPAVADVEATVIGRSGTRAYVAAWVRYVHAHLPSKTIIIYTGAWFWNPSVGGAAGSSNLWISAYANGFIRPVGFRSALIWQYSDGIYGPYPRLHGYDSDIFLGSRAKLAAVFAGHAAKPKAKPVSRHARSLCVELTTIRARARRTHRWTPKGRGKAIKRTLTTHHYSCSHGKIARTK